MLGCTGRQENNILTCEIQSNAEAKAEEENEEEVTTLENQNENVEHEENVENNNDASPIPVRRSTRTKSNVERLAPCVSHMSAKEENTNHYEMSQAKILATIIEQMCHKCKIKRTRTKNNIRKEQYSVRNSI